MHTDRPRRFRRRAVCLAAIACVLAGCATRYTLRTVEPGIRLQWPYQPARAKVTYDRSLTGLARAKGLGSAMKAFVFGADDGSRSSFVLPVAIAVGSDGRIAVADAGLRCVHLYIPSRQQYLRLSGSEHEKVRSPVAVAFDDELRLYLSDSVGRVFAFAPDGTFVFTLERAGERPLERPTGLAYSPRTRLLYVVDTLANRVDAFRQSGDFAFSFGERGEGEGRFNFPTHIFRSAAGELYVTDALNFRIEIFDEAGLPLGSFGHHGDGSGDLAMPKGLAVDRDGVVYVADSLFDNVQLFSRKGDFLLTVGGRGTDFGDFWLPSGLFISENAELYVCDSYNRRIQVFRITEGYATDAP